VLQKTSFPSLWRQILEATSDFLILVEENEDQSRRLAGGWSMAQFPRYRLHLGRKFAEMLEEAIQGWLEVAMKENLLSLDSS